MIDSGAMIINHTNTVHLATVLTLYKISNNKRCFSADLQVYLRLFLMHKHFEY